MVDHEESHDDKNFRVVDKRRFTSEGEVRLEEEAKASDRAVDSPKSAVKESDTPRPDTPDAANRVPRPPIQFMGFILSLATNALAALGVLPNAEEQGLPKSLDLAREYIDILAMLMEKTRGNLTQEEEQTLSQLLTELRLQYVHATK